MLTLDPDSDWGQVLEELLEAFDDETETEWIFSNVYLIFSGEFEKIE